MRANSSIQSPSFSTPPTHTCIPPPLMSTTYLDVLRPRVLLPGGSIESIGDVALTGIAIQQHYGCVGGWAERVAGGWGGRWTHAGRHH